MNKVKTVIKRDNQRQPFSKTRIYTAILKAALETYPDCTEKELHDDVSDWTEYVIDTIEERYGKQVHIEDIQDTIEQVLMNEDKFVAKNYITYRYRHELARDRYSSLMKLVKEKLSATNVQNQNANVDEKSFGGRKGEVTDLILKKLAIEDYLSPMAALNHTKNLIYEHDLGDFVVGSHNCLTIPFDDLLATGFDTRQTDIRPANSVGTAFQLLAVIFQLESLQQFGGVSASHLDWTMVPYVRKSFYKHYCDGMKYIEGNVPVNKPNKPISKLSIQDSWYAPDIYKKVYKYALDMTKKEIEQAVEGMYHNLNTLQSRSGNQLPFTSINYGTCTLLEGQMITEALLRGSIKGVGKHHKTPVFPCGIFQCMKGVNRKPGDPNYGLFRLALESTARRLYPNYCNVDWSINAGYDRNDPRTFVSTMGCRTYNGADINAEPGVNPQMKDGRGNICPVTIILPSLAMLAKEAANTNGTPSQADVIKIFMTILNEKINEAKIMLLERYEWICSQSEESAKFLYENGLMLGYKPEEGIRSALKHGTLAIGQLGLAETLELLVGCNQTTETGMRLAKQIEGLFKEKCAQFKKEEHLNFGVYYTPAENLCYTAMKKFQETYGIISKVSDKDFFTNSIHVPVWEKIDPFQKIDIEAELANYSNAGCITYIELDSSVKNNIDALETLVNYAMDKDLPYFAINVPNDMCNDCGYTDEINDSCPECGGTNIRRLRRVTGYLTGDYKTAFNKGKQQETEMRYKHSQQLNSQFWKKG